MNVDAIWHDVECGGYVADLALWRELAAANPGPVLDVGAGTGRVSVDLASRGHEVVALDSDAGLLAALAERSPGVVTHCADARAFALGRKVGLILVPMQTLQLLGGPPGRTAFLRCAGAHLAPGGLVAAALADALESFDAKSDGLPDPDVCEVDGVRYASLPLAVVDEGDHAAIHRLRQVTAPDQEPVESHDVIRLDRVSAEVVIAEAGAQGFSAEPVRHIAATEEYVGSTVVMLRA